MSRVVHNLSFSARQTLYKLQWILVHNKFSENCNSHGPETRLDARQIRGSPVVQLAALTNGLKYGTPGRGEWILTASPST